jgi:hypothetical protein
VTKWRAGRRPQEVVPEPTARHDVSPEPAPPRKQDRVLDLQRSVGNRAVQEMLPHSDGEPIPKSERDKFEASFGEDFSDVRVHRDDADSRLAEEAGAKALTIERDIYFGEGMYAPQTRDGQFLLAHELTHVVQQELPGSIQEDRLSQPGDAAEIEAREVSAAVFRQDTTPEIVVARRGIQRDEGSGKPSPTPDPYGGSSLLGAFGKSFPDAAKFVAANPEAMKLVKEAETAGVKFGGFAEDGPAKNSWPYTVGDSVYIPKAHADKIVAASDFLFELNNAIRRGKLAEIHALAKKGKTGSLTAKEYARQKVAVEVEGMLRTGQIWAEMKKKAPKGENWDKYDHDFFLASYEAFRDGKKTKDEIIDSILKQVYPEGVNKGKTIEKHYMEQYEELSGGK